MKHWLNQNFKTLIITAFLIPIITVAIVSISHVTKWYGISNPVSWAVYLSIGIEIAALSALAAISVNMGKKVYFPFAVVTLIQFIGNVFFAYSYIDINGRSFRDWVDLVSPLTELMGVDPTDLVGNKRLLAFFAGGMLPIISLSFLHMLVKFTEEDRLKENGLIQNKEPISNPEELKDFVDETTRIHLSENDLKKLEETLLNPPPLNEKLKKAAEEYKRRGELLVEIMENDEELGLYDEPFDNPLVKESSVTSQNAQGMMITTNEDIINSIPPDDETSEMDLLVEKNYQINEDGGKNLSNDKKSEIIVENKTLTTKLGELKKNGYKVSQLEEDEITTENTIEPTSPEKDDEKKK